MGLSPTSCCRCGHRISSGANFCTRCGAPARRVSESTCGRDESGQVPRGDSRPVPEEVLRSRARCAATGQSFGVLFELGVGGRWGACETFDLSEQRAASSVFAGNRVSMRGTTDDYPGCPHCGATGLIFCTSCEELSCCRENQRAAVCPWCKKRARLSGLHPNFPPFIRRVRRLFRPPGVIVLPVL
jgi:hypothetical protein